MNEVKLLQVRGEVANAKDAFDKGLIVEKEVGMEVIYTLIANGVDEVIIADSLGLSMSEFQIATSRTTELRNRYVKAKLFKPAMTSADTLGEFGDVSFMDLEQKRASEHHMSMIKLFLDNSRQDTETGSAITVNNVITVNDKNAEPPPLPEGVGDIIDTEFTHVTP